MDGGVVFFSASSGVDDTHREKREAEKRRLGANDGSVESLCSHVQEEPQNGPNRPREGRARRVRRSATKGGRKGRGEVERAQYKKTARASRTTALSPRR